MKNIYYLTLLIFIISVFRIIKSTDKNKQRELFVSFAIQILSLGLGFQIISILDWTRVDGVIAAFGPNVRVEFVTFASLFLILAGYNKIDKIKIENKFLFFLILLLIAISFLNPLNISKVAIWSPISYYFQIWFLLHLIKSNFNITTIFKGIYDSFFVMSIIQLVLSICYPVLGMSFVGELFQGNLEFSLRREGVVSAMGTYGHPSSLAMVSLTYSLFFISCYWNNYKRKLSLYLFIANIFVVYLTYSRTTYLIAFFIFIVAYNLHKSQLFKTKNIISLVAAVFILFVVINFTSVGDMFLKSDSEQQFYNRTTHWFLGFELWRRSELIGLGINTHVLYMQDKLTSTKIGGFEELKFFLSNPIHNIHIIVLVETGLAGLFSWFYFFAYKLKKTYRRAQLEFKPLKILNITTFSVLVFVFIYGFMGWGVLNRDTSVMFLLLIYYSSISNTQLKKNPVKINKR